MKLCGTVTAQLMAEWRNALSWRAASKWRDSEPATVRKALLFYQELVAIWRPAAPSSTEAPNVRSAGLVSIGVLGAWLAGRGGVRCQH